MIGDDSNPMQGLSLDETLLPSLATAKVPVATLDDPTDYGFDSQNVWDVPGRAAPRRDRRARRPQRPDRPVPDPGEPDRRRVGPAPPPARALHRPGRASPLPHEGQVSRRRLRQPALRHSRRSSTPASRSARSRCRRRASSTRTRTRAAPLADGLTQIAQALAAFQAGSRAAEPRLARASPSSGASSAAGRRRTTRTAPTTAPRAPPS